MMVSECLQMLVLFLGQRCYYRINQGKFQGIDGAGGVLSNPQKFQLATFGLTKVLFNV